jgi:hypothetical protein
MSEEHAKGVKQSIESIIRTDTVLRRKKKSEDDLNRESFEKLIRTMEEIQVRDALMLAELGLDYSDYNEKFYEVIDRLFSLYFGEQASEVIFFYIYERINPDGSVNDLVDQEGKIVPLDSPSDLWYLVNYIKNHPKK